MTSCNNGTENKVESLKSESSRCFASLFSFSAKECFPGAWSLNYGYPALNPAFQTSRDPLDVFLGIQEAPNDCFCKITVRKGNNFWLNDWQLLDDCFIYKRFSAFFYYHPTILIFYRCHDSEEIQKLWHSSVKLGFHLIVTDCINHLEFSFERIETII